MAANDRVQVFKSQSGKWYWRVKAANGRTITTSGESFASKSNAKRAALRVTGREASEA